MDWQQLVSLIIVVAAAASFAGSSYRRRRFSFQRVTHCSGCAVPQASQNSIVFRARKGQRAEIRLKSSKVE